MQIGLDEDQQSLRKQLREYYARILTPEVTKALEVPGITATHRRIARQMGSDGWLGIGWPKEYGGQGRSTMEQFIFFDES
ncbi:MAG TPA: acyl-CoA dehydrogenase family protein, partial [Acidimicrobiales bacterium]|nr:acyl-CoA dehydrogenase family protein [Acidimicrobiales bacterium]